MLVIHLSSKLSYIRVQLHLVLVEIIVPFDPTHIFLLQDQGISLHDHVLLASLGPHIPPLGPRGTSKIKVLRWSSHLRSGRRGVIQDSSVLSTSSVLLLVSSLNLKEFSSDLLFLHHVIFLLFSLSVLIILLLS